LDDEIGHYQSTRDALFFKNFEIHVLRTKEGRAVSKFLCQLRF